jgi:DNA-binding response OmpR family regulator
MPRKSVSSTDSSEKILRILLVASDTQFVNLTSNYLEQLGFQVESVTSGCAGLQRANNNTWHAVILDEGLADMLWLEVIRRLRSFTNIPLIVASGAETEVSRIAGLNMGADDYFAKHISSVELVARIRAVLRRAGWAVHERPIPVVSEVVVGELRLRLGTYTAYLGECALNLTRTEFDVLLTLARSAGKVCTREKLVESSKGGVWQVFDRGIDMHISSLRRALGDESKEPRYIRTVRGVGYVLTMTDSALPI